jgi:hypothetical protein
MIDYEEIFNLSYWRVTSNKVDGVAFVDAFLDALLRSSDEVARKMAGADLERFRSGLTLAIVHLASYYERGRPHVILQGIAQRQSRTGRNIEPHLYEYFLQALLQTVQRYDPQYDGQIGEAWKTVLRPGLDYMKRMY